MTRQTEGRGSGSAPVTLLYLRKAGAQHGYALLEKSGGRFFVEERGPSRPSRYPILAATAERILALPSGEALTELWRCYHAARLACRARSVGDSHAHTQRR